MPGGLQEKWQRARGVARSLRTYYGGGDRDGLDRLYRGLLCSGDLVFDIGAHVGSRTAAFRRLGARVVAVEPQPALAKLLRLLFAADRAVTVEATAVGRSTGYVELKLNIDNPTVSSASPEFLRAAAGAVGWEGQAWDKVITVPLTTIDALIARHGAPKFIKIDIEGFEAEALAGLTHPPPALSFEFTTVAPAIAAAALERCVALGYRRFNAVLGEQHAFVHQKWLAADAVGAWMAALPHAANSGDLYAVAA